MNLLLSQNTCILLVLHFQLTPPPLGIVRFVCQNIVPHLLTRKSIPSTILKHSTLLPNLQNPLTLASNRATASGPPLRLRSTVKVARTGEVAESERLGRNGMGVLGRLVINYSRPSFSTRTSLERDKRTKGATGKAYRRGG